MDLPPPSPDPSVEFIAPLRAASLPHHRLDDLRTPAARVGIPPRRRSAFSRERFHGNTAPRLPSGRRVSWPEAHWPPASIVTSAGVSSWLPGFTRPTITVVFAGPFFGTVSLTQRSGGQSVIFWSKKPNV